MPISNLTIINRCARQLFLTLYSHIRKQNKPLLPQINLNVIEFTFSERKQTKQKDKYSREKIKVGAGKEDMKYQRGYVCVYVRLY